MLKARPNPVPGRALPLLLLVLVAFLVVEFRPLAAPLWLDDCWTGNSVREPSLRGMLRYDGWMQVTPPLFLFVLRWCVAWAEPDWIWRIVPLAGTLMAVVWFWRLVKRELGPLWAVAGVTLFLFSEAVITQAGSIKSYSWETAIGVALLAAGVDAFRRLTAGSLLRFHALACLLVVSGYSAPLQIAAASLLPLWALWLRRRRGVQQPALLFPAGSLVSAALFAVVYLTMLAPNTEPALREFWFTGPRAAPAERVSKVVVLLPGSRILTDAPLPALAVIVVCIPALLLAFRRIRSRQWIKNAPAVAGWAMLLLAALGEASHLIPLSPRGGVYLVPWGVVAVLGTLRVGCRIGRSSLSETGWRRASVALLAVLLLGAGHSSVCALSGAEMKREDFRAIVGDLGADYAPGDRLIVHSSTREQFKYYSRMAGFSPLDIVWGETAWPCCVRGKQPFLIGSPETLEREAFPAGTPMPARIFLTVLSYDGHWRDCGGDERPVWRDVLLKRGCRPAGSKAYGSADLLTFSCGAK